MSLYKALGGLPPQAAGPAAPGSPGVAVGPQGVATSEIEQQRMNSMPSLYESLQHIDPSTQPLQLGPMVADGRKDVQDFFRRRAGIPLNPPVSPPVKK